MGSKASTPRLHRFYIGFGGDAQRTDDVIGKFIDHGIIV
jgi:hypothetical protein